MTIALALGGVLLVAVLNENDQEKLGQVHFPISCTGASQRQFDLATARLHSFSFNEAERYYAAIAKADPDCAMAYWGIAISRLRRPIPGKRPVYDFYAAQEALRLGRAARVATTRERDYIAALSLLFDSGNGSDWDDRTIAYERAMRTLAARERGDQEATIFYALALNIVAREADPKFERRAKAAELLLLALAKQPNHPGLSHYLTYCLKVSPEEGAAVEALRHDRFGWVFKDALVTLAFLGVCAFFVAVWPVWSRAEGT
ncbi:MAG: hypothetical protein JO328_02560 [Hyphomicrobiales bacterium]|nr:hypothetical protein [Hyphomicrobiales bacterium]